jgi:tetratricopeptide (TPR) repeat protein
MTARPSPRPKWLFWTILVLLVVLLPLALLEMGVRASGVRVADDPYLQFGPVQPFFVKETVKGREYYQVAKRRLYRERNVMFPVKKDPGTFRIFCLGASASAGWPHPSQEIYSSYLQEALQRAYPDRKIEVINVSAHAYPTYRIRLILQDVLELEPDLVIIYSGDNEFIEPRSYSVEAHWYDPLAEFANHWRLYRVLRGTPVARRWFPENTLPSERLAIARGNLLAQIAPKVRSDPKQFERAKEHYAFSIESMVASAQEMGVPVILVATPVNLLDWHPNVSDQELTGDALVRWQEHYTKGQAALLKGDADAAVSEFKLAASLNPQHAETHFFLGNALDKKGEFAESIKELSLARDLDFYPSRALSKFNDTMRRAAAEHEGAELADAEAAFWAASAPHAPGFEFFLDYVHPNKRGSLIVAKTVFDTIVQHKLIDGAQPAEFTYEAKPFYCGNEQRPAVKGGCGPEGVPYDDNADLPMQVLLVGLSMNMNQDQHVLDQLTKISNSPYFDQLDEKSSSFVKDGLAVYTPLMALRRQRLLGEPVDAEMKTAVDNLEQFRVEHFKGYAKVRKKSKKAKKSKLHALN